MSRITRSVTINRGQNSSVTSQTTWKLVVPIVLDTFDGHQQVKSRAVADNLAPIGRCSTEWRLHAWISTRCHGPRRIRNDLTRPLLWIEKNAEANHITRCKPFMFWTNKAILETKQNARFDLRSHDR
jgi:hypothetical protein